ncbi:Cation-efflux pump FieF [Candidatus Terasakiella magnetica]|nr:Cation-efflux pump FieF [Candidatus Terasakiella magnetica]
MEPDTPLSLDHSAARLMRWATYASTFTAALLIAVKLTAWVMTDSVALLSTLIDSTLDLGASVLNLMAVRHALTPADREHRFGHGKAEALAGLGQAAFILGSGALLLVEAMGRLIHPQAVARSEVGIGVLIFAIVATAILVRFQRHVVSRTGSLAISADSLHYAGDVALNGSVIVSLLLSRWLEIDWIDPLFAIAIGGWLLFNAWQVARGSLDSLMDHELPDAERNRIRDIARSHPQVRNLHDLRTRTAGHQGFVQFHLELDGTLLLMDAHRIADEVEQAILTEFPRFEVIIHEDPVGIRESHPNFG